METQDCSFYNVPCWLGWLRDEMKEIFKWIMLQVLEAVAAVIEWIPVPEFLQDIGQYQLPDSVIFFATLFQLQAGMGIIVSAYTLRFIIRRLPFVG